MIIDLLVMIACLYSRLLERRLQRPLLAKSRTLPSIPQSPAAIRVQQSENVCERQHRPRVPSSPGGLEACTLPPAGIACVFVFIYVYLNCTPMLSKHILLDSRFWWFCCELHEKMFCRVTTKKTWVSYIFVSHVISFHFALLFLIILIIIVLILF